MKYLNFNSKLLISGILLIVLGLCSCKKYLDLKPDKLQTTPTTLKDCQALLDDYNTMNAKYPGEGEALADNYYYTDPTFNTLTGINVKDTYLWKPYGEIDLVQWQNPYKTVYQSNLVLQVLDKIGADVTGDYNSIKGQALFYRSFAFYSVAQLFTKPYNEATANNDLGIPLRLSPDLSDPSVRGTVKESYERILQDLKEAVNLLPTSNLVKTRPTRVAAFAMLARTYLAMGKYAEAGIYADSCLRRYDVLINYASLAPSVPTSTAPTFTRLNAEVIFPALGQLASPLFQTITKIDTMLYNSYQQNDARKASFFVTNTGTDEGTFGFKGSYDGANSTLFCGLATDEMYLIRAECYARAGDVQAAMADLNTLMKNRWIGPFTDFTASNADDALSQILQERRKELIFRTLRWTDLRRLNNEGRFVTVLTRSMNNLDYLPLQPNDLRYTLLIPREVINTTNMPQNAR